MTLQWTTTHLLFCLLCIGTLLLSGCQALQGDTETNTTAPRLPSTLVTRLFEQDPTPQQSESGDELYFLCTVSEGTFCYFVPATAAATYNFTYNPDIETPANRINDADATEILNALDVQSVERAKNNIVLVHCIRDSGSALTCTINGGGGWEAVSLF
jgi:hypothetical protein